MSSITVSTDIIRIFFCYAREDEALRNELEKQLRILKRQGQVSSWHDREISAGKEWEREIDTHLNTAQVILLLVSSDFMDSDYCYGVEMKRALERHDAGEVRVIPIILRHVYWENSPFSKLQVLPTDGKPVKSWLDRDEAFLDIARGIQKVVKELALFYKINEGDTQCKYKQYEEALGIYEQVINLNPNLIRAYIGKGNALANLERSGEALVAFEQAIRLDSKSAIAHYGTGLALYDLERYKEALNVCNRAIDLDPNLARAYYTKGNVLAELNRNIEALEAYDQAIYLDPKTATVYHNKGSVLRVLKQYTEAVEAYDQAIHLDPKTAIIHYNRGKALYELKRYTQALEAYKQAIRLDPTFIEAYNDRDELLQHLEK